MSDTNGPPTTEYEVTASGIRAVFGVIPFVGAAVGEAAAWLVIAPAARQRDEWLRMLAGRVRRLESMFGIRPENLAASSEWTTLVMHATRIAMGTHQTEKHHALRAAITNAALDPDPDFDQRMAFLRWIDELTVTHIALLRFFDEPIAVFEARGVAWRELATFMEGVEAAVPGLAGRTAFYTLINNDLHSRGLGAGSDITGADPDTWRRRYTRDIGRDFLQFITDPLPDEEPTHATES